MTDEGIVIEDEVVEVQEEQSFDTEGLTDQEIEKAQELGLVEKENSEEEGEESEEELKSATDFIDEKGNVDLEGLEEAERNKKLNPLSTKERGLLKSVKIERLKRQDASQKAKEYQEKLDKFNAERELSQIKDGVANTKLERIQEALKREDLTTTELEAIINDEAVTTTKTETPEAQKLREYETQKQTQEAQTKRNTDIQQAGLTLHDDFPETVQIANEWIEKHPNSLYARTVNEAFNNPQVDAVDVVEMVYEIAEKSGKKVDRTVDPNIERIKKNASKKKSSASIGSSKGGKVVSYADITPAQASKLSNEEWIKIPAEHRARIRKAVMG